MSISPLTTTIVGRYMQPKTNTRNGGGGREVTRRDKRPLSSTTAYVRTQQQSQSVGRQFFKIDNRNSWYNRSTNTKHQPNPARETKLYDGIYVIKPSGPFGTIRYKTIRNATSGMEPYGTAHPRTENRVGMEPDATETSGTKSPRTQLPGTTPSGA